MGVAVRSWSMVTWTVVVAAGLFHLYVAFARPGGPEGMSDFGVYRLAAQAVLAGSDPYGIASPLNGDRFVYPPFAALLLAPRALLPEPAARLVWTGAQWALVVLLAAVIRPHLSAPAVRRLPGPLHTPVLAALLLLSYPIFSGLFLSQLSLLIMVLMLVDALDILPRKASGICWGLAAGLKLTPVVLLPWLWWTGRRRAALVGAVTFTVTIVLGWCLLPGPSAGYWPSATDVPDFVQLSQLDNQSLRGLLARAGWSSPPRTALVLTLAALALLAYRGACHLYRQGRVLDGAVVVGALAVLASPLSWSHHQTALVLAAGCAVSSRRVLTTAWSAVVYVIMVLPWPFLLPPGSPGRWLLGELPLLVALVVIGSAAGCALRASRRRRPPTPMSMSTAQATEMTRGAES